MNTPSVLVLDDDELDVPAGATVSSQTGRPAALVTPAGMAIAIDETSLNPKHDIKANNAQQSILIGRQQATADIRIQHSSISRRHAVLYYCNTDDNDNDDTLYLKSCGGVTLVNGKKLAKGAVVALVDGDTVQLGTLRENIFTIQRPRAAAVAAAANGSCAVSRNGHDEAAAAAAVLSAPPTTTKLSDQERLEQAGAGLSGRQKRQAEIQVMMASLDETPAYTQTTDEVQRQAQERYDDKVQQHAAHEQLQRLQLAKELQIPVASQFVVAGPPRSAVATCLAVDPAGARFVVGGRDTSLRFFDFGGLDRSRNAYFKSLVPEAGYAPVSTCYSSTGDRLLVATGSLQPIVLDRNGQTLLKFVRGDVYVSDPTRTIGHTAAVTAVTWHPHERDLVATASLDGSVRLWDLARGKKQFDMLVCGKVFPVKNQRGHKTAVTCLCFHPLGNGHEFVVGTACGSLQIWNRARVSNRPERVLYEAHGADQAIISSVTYSLDGTKIASRSANDDVAKVWEAKQLGVSSAKPVALCGNAATIHEQCNAVFDPTTKRLCLAVSNIQDANQKPPVECGAIHIYDIQTNAAGAASDAIMIRAPILVIPLGIPTGGTLVHWHHQINQIFVALSNGQAICYCDPRMSTKGAVLVCKKAGKGVDALEELLREKKPQHQTHGAIIAPLHREDFNVRKQPNKRKRNNKDDDEGTASKQKMEPERPNKFKHQTGAQVGGAISFQQFVADQRITKSKEIAGKDPREALLQYTTGKSFVDRAYKGNESKLAEKTAEQEEDDADT